MKNQLYLLIFLTVFALYAICDECDELTKINNAMIFCEKTINCLNETDKELHVKFRSCFADKNPEFKELVESANKLEPDKCLEKVSSGVCPFLEQVESNQDNYTDCFDYNGDQLSCIRSLRLNADFEMTKMICADPSKIKCETKRQKESINLYMDCIKENIPGMSELINKQLETTKCKTDADEIIRKNIEKTKLKDFIACLGKDKNLKIFRKIWPLYTIYTKQCAGFV